MSSNNEFYDALMDGRWQPDINLREEETKSGTEFIAEYVQGELTVRRSSKWNVTDAESQLHDELRRGALEGEYYPIQ